MSWALRTHSVIVYPIIDRETYKAKSRCGKYTNTINKVRLVVRVGNAEHKGTNLYRQDMEMTNKIQEIYEHYYNKRTR